MNDDPTAVAGEEVPEAPPDSTPLLMNPLALGGGAAAALLVAFVLLLVARMVRNGASSATIPAPPPAAAKPASVGEAAPPPERARAVPPTEDEEDDEGEITAVMDRGESVVLRFAEALARSRAALKERFDALFGAPVDESVFQQLEEALLAADVGVPMATALLDPLRAKARSGASPTELRQVLRQHIREMVSAPDPRLSGVPADGPLVLLIVGVNGSGKTTTIGKLAARFAAAGHKVLLAAGDTFRAAASDQLAIWAERTGADLVRHDSGADPGAVTFDALAAAKARGCDVVIVDTAGRLQTRKPLMEQLSKVRRVIEKQVPGAPHETLLVLDGTMGQNALSQAQLFHEATPLTGVIVTKLDGTAKGGMILAITGEMKLPVKFVGIGEKVDDLKPFDGHAFAEVLA